MIPEKSGPTPEFLELYTKIIQLIQYYDPMISASVLCRVVASMTISQPSPKEALEEFKDGLLAMCRDALAEELGCK